MPATPPASWQIEPAHTHIGFSVRHLGLTNTPGIFRRFSAALDFNDQQIEASQVSFEIEAASLDTALDLRDEHLRGSDWFDVQQYPVIRFASHTVRHVADKHYLIEGDLTLRGKTLPIAFDTRLIDRATNPWTQGPVVGFEASAVLSRQAYGMGAFPHALADEVRVTVSIEVIREA